MVRFPFQKAKIVVEDIVLPLSHSQMVAAFLTSLYQRTVVPILANSGEILARMHALFIKHFLNTMESYLENIRDFAYHQDQRIFFLSTAFVLAAAMTILASSSSRSNDLMTSKMIQEQDEHVTSKTKSKARKTQTIHRREKDEVIVHSDDSSSSSGNSSAMTTEEDDGDNGSASAFNSVINMTPSPSFGLLPDYAFDSGKITAASITTSNDTSTPTSSPPPTPTSFKQTNRIATSINIVVDDKVSKIKDGKMTKEDVKFDKLVKTNFPGAISNQDLAVRVREVLDEKGFTPQNTLLATSVCADELARELEDEFVAIYGTNFNLGGLAGFPFAGNTGWGAMSAHVPDNGYCLTIHGPHVGITKDGLIGKVERSGIALVDSCCGSAIAASNYLRGITEGTATINPRIQNFSDFQQGAVQELILPFGRRLAKAEDRMKELPYALYDSQKVLVNDIVNTGKASIKKGLAVLGGIQINTSPDTPDYFHPLRFDYYDENGDLVENMLPYLK